MKKETGVKIHFRNGKVLNCKLVDKKDVKRFGEWIAEHTFTEDPFININGDYVINMKEVIYFEPYTIPEIKNDLGEIK